MERLGEREVAEGMYREALDIRLAEMGEEHRSVGITANNLAVVSYNLGKLDSAVHYGEQAVRSLRLALGDDHQRSVIAQMNLAAFKSRAGDYAAAEVEYRDLLERQRRLQGPDHPVVGIIMNNLGRALWRQGRHVEAVVQPGAGLAERGQRTCPVEVASNAYRGLDRGVGSSMAGANGSCVEQGGS